MTGKQTDLQIRRQRLLLPTYFLMDFVVMVEGGGGGGRGRGTNRNKRFMASHSPIVQKRFVACRSYWHTGDN